MDGVGAALGAAAQLPPECGFVFLPGVEISAAYGGGGNRNGGRGKSGSNSGGSGAGRWGGGAGPPRREIHILGYFLPQGGESLAPFIEMMKRERTARNLRIIGRLNALGVRVSAEDAEAEAKKSVFGRPHIAAALVKKGYARDMNGAFERYLAFGGRAYAPKESPTPAECVAAIHEAGGVAAIAHPMRSGLRQRELKALIAELAPHGLSGIEAYYADNTPQDTANCVAIASAFGLIMTGGSDFHGEYRKNVRLGSGRGNLRVPDELPDILIERLQRMRRP
jgi:predicted metal-dependent phosphoesterase TrpH